MPIPSPSTASGSRRNIFSSPSVAGRRCRSFPAPSMRLPPTKLFTCRRCRSGSSSLAAVTSAWSSPASFTVSGAQTTQLYRGELFLRGFDDDIRKTLADEMRKRGIDLRFNSRITNIEKSGAVLKATLTDGNMIWKPIRSSLPPDAAPRRRISVWKKPASN